MSGFLFPAETRAQRAAPEARLQHAVMQYLALALPPDAIAHHSPGEGMRGLRAQRDLKRSGFKSGWPDVEIVYRGRVYFIELKAPKGTLSAAQRAMLARLNYCGAPAMVARSVEEAAEALLSWDVPLRARVLA